MYGRWQREGGRARRVLTDGLFAAVPQAVDTLLSGVSRPHMRQVVSHTHTLVHTR